MALNKQIWTSQIMENFYPNTSFLKKCRDFSEFVNNDKIHIPSAGVDPKVLINNTTYPIKTVIREDYDNEIELDVFSTENTKCRRPEDLEVSYNKLESVIGQHRSTLQTAVAKKAIHAFAPLADTLDTPLVQTTGAAANGRKRIKFEDILTLKERFDDALVPLEERYIVLHPKHVTDLMLEDLELFKNLTDLDNGEPRRFAGFGCFAFPFMPCYNGMEKVAYSDNMSGSFASVAFHAKEVMYADGSIYMYSRYDDPEERATIVGFDKRFIAVPIRNKGIGAIVSTNV